MKKKIRHLADDFLAALLLLEMLIGWPAVLLVLANKSTPGVLGLGMVFFGVNMVMLIRGR